MERATTKDLTQPPLKRIPPKQKRSIVERLGRVLSGACAVCFMLLLGLTAYGVWYSSGMDHYDTDTSKLGIDGLEVAFGHRPAESVYMRSGWPIPHREVIDFANEAEYQSAWEKLKSIEGYHAAEAGNCTPLAEAAYNEKFELWHAPVNTQIRNAGFLLHSPRDWHWPYGTAFIGLTPDQHAAGTWRIVLAQSEYRITTLKDCGIQLQRQP